MGAGKENTSALPIQLSGLSTGVQASLPEPVFLIFCDNG